MWWAAPIPDRPAPTIRTSRCSTGSGTASGRRAGRDQLVVEGALVTEELRAPLLHQLGGVAVVGVEVGTVVLVQLAPHRTRHDRRAAEPSPAAPDVAGPIRGAI